jgi:hypothetical protein
MRSSRSILVLGLALAACSDTIPPTSANVALTSAPLRVLETAEGELVAGQIIVQFRPGAARSEIAEAHRAKKKDDMRLEHTEILEVPVGEELAVAAELSKNPNVVFAEPEWVARVGPCEVASSCDLPDGGFWAFKWDLYNTGSFIAPAVQPGLLVNTGRADADIDLAELYDHLGPSYGGSAVLGILDTGIRPTHSLFAGKILAGMRFVVDGQPATNFIDDHGHGSHVAGIAAGRATAAFPGVAYGANIKLLVAKVCNAQGLCPNSGTANAIIWAADNGANVLNLSLGSFGGNPDGTGSAAQQAAFQYARGKNVLPVCATGNDDGKPNYFGGVGYPSRFPECMAVGASDWGDTKASYSNYGPQIAVSAPGGDGEHQPYSLIMSASRNGDNSYTFNAGTSMATPQVAGLAAMLYATGMTDPAAVQQRIIETADDIEAPGFDPRTGWGRINAYRAVTGIDPNAAPVSKPGAGYAGLRTFAIHFDGSESFDPNLKPISYAWNFGDPSSSDNTSTVATPSHVYSTAGVYTATLTVTDAAGLTNTATAPVIVWNAQQGIQNLLIDTFGQGGTSGLSDGIITSLNAKLRAAQRSLDEGNNAAAASQINAFTNEVAALERSGRLSAATSASLIAIASQILQSMN